MVLCRREGANTDIASSIRVETTCGSERIRVCRDRSGVSESVELERGWTVGGLHGHFLSQISMLTDWDVLMLQECFRKLDGVNVGAHDLFNTKGKKLGEFEALLMDIQEFVSGRPKQHVILGGDFNASLYGMTDFFHVGESIPRPRTLVDTNDSLRARALHTMVTELDLTVTNTWMNADTEQELFTRSSWTNPKYSLTQMDFIMTSRKLEMKHVQVLDSDWFKTDHSAVLAVLSMKPKMRHTMRNGVNLRGWEPDESWHRVAAETLTEMGELECDGAFAYGNGDSSQKTGNQRDVSDRTRAQITSVEKQENRTAPRANRLELALSSNLEKAESAEARDTLGQDQGECRDGESPQEKAKQAFQLELDSKTRKPRICSHKLLPRPLLNSGRPGGGNPIRETTLGRAVEKLENGLCKRNVDFTKESGKCLDEIEKREKFTGSNHSRCFESIASRMFGEIGEIAVVDVLGYDFPGRLAVLYDGNGSESGGCNVLDQVQANRWAVCAAKRLGLRMAQVTPSTEIRERSNCVCAEVACRCWTVSAVASGRVVESGRKKLW